MKITSLRSFGILTLTLIYASVFATAFASIWESGKIVYTSQRGLDDLDIYTMGPNGDDKTPLTLSAANDYDPTWSPNGKQILFVSDRSGRPDIYIMDDDGDNQERVRLLTRHRTSPTWAPDGRRIAYALNLQRIYIFNLVTRLPEYLIDGANPAWSPDGRYIAFIRGGIGAEGKNGASLYVIDLETLLVRKLVTGDSFLEISDPTWGPQSTYIVFSQVGVSEETGIYYVSRWGGVPKRLYYWDDYHLHHPDISPYGGETLFEVHPHDYTHQHIYKLTHRTTHSQQLTSGSGYNFDPDWWHPTSFPVEKRDSQVTTTWGEIKKK